MSIKQITKLRYKTKDKPPMEGVPLLGYNKRYDCPWTVVYRSKDKYYTCMFIAAWRSTGISTPR